MGICGFACFHSFMLCLNSPLRYNYFTSEEEESTNDRIKGAAKSQIHENDGVKRDGNGTPLPVNYIIWKKDCPNQI